MKKKIVSTLVVIGLLIVLGDTVTTFNIGRNRKLNILPLFQCYGQTTGNAERYKENHC